MIYSDFNDGKPAVVRSRLLENGNGLSMHVLECGFENQNRPCVLLLHGFPEIAYSWRKLLPLLAAAGFYAVAPDQRGYGRTIGWDDSYEPRKHYQWYFSTRAADADMRDCPQGLHAFLRAYFHVKSADWKPNLPRPLKSWAADELAKMPE